MQDLTRDVAHVARMLKAGLGLRGETLAAQLRSGGRLLPRRVRAAAQRLAEAEAMLQVPKLAKQLDAARLQADIGTCMQHLTPLVQHRVRHGWWLRAASWAALALFIGGLVFAGLRYLLT
jgi:hypothetical protein